MEQHGLTPEEAADNFWVLDADGLITEERADLPAHVRRFARSDERGTDGERLLETIRRVKPTCLIGLAGAGRLFTKDVLQAMAEVTPRPIIFPMSNPIAKMECTHQEAIKHTKASGAERERRGRGRTIIEPERFCMVVWSVQSVR